MTDDDIRGWFKGPTPPSEEALRLARDRIEPALMSAVYEECQSILGDRPTVNDVRAAVARAISLAEQVWSDLADESPEYACEKGCAWCCHQTVMVVAPEVIFVADHKERAFDDASREELRRQLAERRRAISGRTTADRQTLDLACGALANAACSVHPGRPLPCRGGFSSDAGFCRDLFEDFTGVLAALDEGTRAEPFLTVPKTLFNSAQVGLVNAFKEIGYRCPPLELTAALDVAMSLPDPGATWIADEGVFADAELRKVGNDYVTNAT